MEDGYKNFFRKAQKNHLTKKKSKGGFSFNPKLIGLSVGALIIAALAGYTIYDEGEWINNVSEKVEIKFLGIAKAADGKATSKGKGKKGEKSAAKSGQKDSAGKAEDAAAEQPKKEWTAEEVTLFMKLEDRKKQLDQREVELQKLEEELQKSKEEIEKRMVQLDDVRRKIASHLDEKVKVDQAKVDSLVLVYQNMKPANAAKVFEDMNEDLAVEVMAKMKNKATAEILNLINPQKAKRLTERFAGYKE